MLGVALLLALLYYLPDLLPESLADKLKLEWGMYLLIIGGGGATLVWSYFHTRTLDREYKLASEQAELLQRVDYLHEFYTQARDDSYFREHILNLHRIAQGGGEARQDNLVEVLNTRLMSKNRMIELLSSMLITLGLIGTILGLMQMMGLLTLALDGNAAEGQGGGNLIGSLFGENGPLRGLDTAFITTLLGAMFGGLILRILCGIMDGMVSSYSTHLVQLTEVYVLPAIRREVAAQLAASKEDVRDKAIDTTPNTSKAVEGAIA
ncbi:MAG: hypothetical protein ACIAXF_01505 [Phycisphaerales bacterium JB063]